MFPATGFTPVVQRLLALLRLYRRQYSRLAHRPLNHRGRPGGDEITASPQIRRGEARTA